MVCKRGEIYIKCLFNTECVCAGLIYLYCIFLMCLLSSSLLLWESSEISILGVEPNWMTPTLTWETHRKHLKKVHTPEKHHRFKPAPIVEAQVNGWLLADRVCADVQSFTQFQYTVTGPLEAALPNTVRAVHQEENIYSCRALHHCKHTHEKKYNISLLFFFTHNCVISYLRHFYNRSESLNLLSCLTVTYFSTKTIHSHFLSLPLSVCVWMMREKERNGTFVLGMLNYNVCSCHAGTCSLP